MVRKSWNKVSVISWSHVGENDILACTTFFAAASKFASSRTRTGLWSPSSIKTGLRYFPARLPMIRPTAALPMNSTFLNSGWLMMASVTAGPSAREHWILFRHPGGSPASVKTSNTSWCVQGHSSEALKTTVQPAARAAAIPRHARMVGAFQLQYTVSRRINLEAMRWLTG